MIEDEAKAKGQSIATFIQGIDAMRGVWPLASALRLATLAAAQRQPWPRLFNWKNGMIHLKWDCSNPAPVKEGMRND